MRPGVSRLLKLCVLGEFYARFSQDAQVNETLKDIQQITTAAHNGFVCDIPYNYIYMSEKIWLDFLCELSAQQTIHVK